MKHYCPIVLIPSLLLLVIATQGKDFFPQFKNKRKNTVQIGHGNTTKNTNLQSSFKENIALQSEDQNKEDKSLTVHEIDANQPSISFDGLNGGTLTGGLIPPVGLASDVAAIVAKAGFVSTFVATVLGSFLLPLQIAEVVLSIIAISMTIAYSLGVTKLSTLRSDTNYSEDNEIPEFDGVVFNADLTPLTPPGFLQISKTEGLSSMKKKKKGEAPTVWNTVFESRSYSSSPFLQDLSHIVLNALLKYS